MFFHKKRIYVLVVFLMVGSSVCFIEYDDYFERNSGFIKSGSVGVREYFGDLFHVWCGMLRNHDCMGTIAPSSFQLVKKITKYIPQVMHNVRILEVGPGTGVVTRELVTRLDKGSQLDIVEIDEKMCHILQEKINIGTNIRIHCCAIQDWDLSDIGIFDYIISTVPFNQLPKDEVLRILATYSRLIKKGGIISYIAYCGGTVVGRLFVRADEQGCFDEKIETIKLWRNAFEMDRDFVIFNMPPAYVYHLHARID